MSGKPHSKGEEREATAVAGTEEEEEAEEGEWGGEEDHGDGF